MRQVLTEVRNDCGQPASGPSGVAAQSVARISAPMSPPPARKSGSDPLIATLGGQRLVAPQQHRPNAA
ncbi:MAG: hypothetical protein U1E53_27920 [Dongiaceae bacterium]